MERTFEAILNRPIPQENPEICENEEDLDISTEPPTVKEVYQAIKKMKSDKTPGEDEITAEMLKGGEMEICNVLCQIFSNIWENEEAPEEWKSGLIVKLPKRGDLTTCDNWRGVTLLSLTSKVFSRILLDRFSTTVEDISRNEQAGFRKGRSCIDHIFVLRQILEQAAEWNSNLYVLFIDFEKAFDSLYRETLWKILRGYGFPIKIVNIIQMLYRDFHCKVICRNQLTDSFKVQIGVKQGCILSPFLLVLAVDWLMRQTNEGQNRGIQWTLTSSLEDLVFADDISMLSSRHRDIQDKSDRLITLASQLGMNIQVKKTKIMKMNTNDSEPVIINNQHIEEVDEFTYLGSKVSTDGDSGKDVQARLAKANQAFGSLNTVSKSKQLRVKTKIRIFKSNVLSVLLYGSECWKMTKEICKKLDTFQTKCLRRIRRIFWPEKIRNEDLLKSCNMEPISACQEKKVKMVGPCFEIAEQQPGKSGAKVDSTREAQEGQAQNNMAEICGGGAERRGTNNGDCQ